MYIGYCDYPRLSQKCHFITVGVLLPCDKISSCDYPIPTVIVIQIESFSGASAGPGGSSISDVGCGWEAGT